MILGANREPRAVGVVALGSPPSVMPKILNPVHFLCIEMISSGWEMLYENRRFRAAGRGPAILSE